ncbi:MAG: aconitase X catalytic domain-containing protein [Rhizobiaceae bacterium]|nr:aconitase X catalytic domain-containing protein [Rhizobiaceae bacterium]
MKLSSDEQAMLDGEDGSGRQKAMELLVRYGEALGAEKFVDTDNVTGTMGSSSTFIRDYFDTGDDRDKLFSYFDLDSDEAVEIPKARTFACHLQTRFEPQRPDLHDTPAGALEFHQDNQEYTAGLGVKMLNTCTPYVVGNTPAQGEHCAWMESSAVVYCNSVLGARTNTEGRESTSAAMLTGKIPDWGFHRDEYRFGSHHVKVETPIESVMDWGMMGYYVGKMVQENIPVIEGISAAPELIHHKHFGAAAASSGGVEMYHVVGHTPEADSLEQALGSRKSAENFVYGINEMREAYDELNAQGNSDDIDYVMLGCPHYTLEQIAVVCRLIEGKKVHENSNLWIFTSRAVRNEAIKHDFHKIIAKAGAVLMTDTCSAMASATPAGTKVAATDSAKQTYYLPSMLGVEAWFGSTKDCVDAALTSKWRGVCP